MHLPLSAGRFRSFCPGLYRLCRASRIRYNQLPVRIRLPRHAIKHRLQMLFFRPVCRNDDTDAQGSRMLPLERKCLFVRLLPSIDLLFLPNPLQHRPHGISDSVFLQIIPGFFPDWIGKKTDIRRTPFPATDACACPSAGKLRHRARAVSF